MSNAAKNAKPAPAQLKSEPSKEVADPKLYSYYRVRKISGFLSEILKVEVDESQVKPVRAGKEDERGILLDRVRDMLDSEAKANFTTDRAATVAKAAAGK